MKLYSKYIIYRLSRQLDVLEPGSIALNTFWHDDKEESFDGLRFIYYLSDGLKQMLPAEFEL